MKRLFIIAMLLLMGLSTSACTSAFVTNDSADYTYTSTSADAASVPQFDGYSYF